VAYKRSWREIFGGNFQILDKERKRTKKKVQTAYGKCRSCGKKQSAALLFSTAAWIKPSQKRARFYPHFPQAGRRIDHLMKNEEAALTRCFAPLKIGGAPEPLTAANSCATKSGQLHVLTTAEEQLKS
jgi:hypothetical protein